MLDTKHKVTLNVEQLLPRETPDVGLQALANGADFRLAPDFDVTAAHVQPYDTSASNPVSAPPLTVAASGSGTSVAGGSTVEGGTGVAPLPPGREGYPDTIVTSSTPAVSANPLSGTSAPSFDPRSLIPSNLPSELADGGEGLRAAFRAVIGNRVAMGDVNLDGVGDLISLPKKPDVEITAETIAAAKAAKDASMKLPPPLSDGGPRFAQFVDGAPDSIVGAKQVEPRGPDQLIPAPAKEPLRPLEIPRQAYRTPTAFDRILQDPHDPLPNVRLPRPSLPTEYYFEQAARRLDQQGAAGPTEPAPKGGQNGGADVQPAANPPTYPTAPAPRLKVVDPTEVQPKDVAPANQESIRIVPSELKPGVVVAAAPIVAAEPASTLSFGTRWVAPVILGAALAVGQWFKRPSKTE